VHFWIAGFVLVLCRGRGGDQGGIDHGAGFEQQAALGQQVIDNFQDLLRIPVNVTADSGNVTGNSGERDRWVGVARFNFMPSCFFG
jgi:hypothetical protein